MTRLHLAASGRRHHWLRSVASVSFAFAAMSPNLAKAQDADLVEEVVVTGTNIRGAPTNAALPVSVIGSEELAKRGSPSALELIKSLPVVAGVLGDSNQFDSRSQGTTGSGSVNLRGLGQERTLVLLNGRRLAANPSVSDAGGAVDTNLLPLAAIDRVEILKDGAAAIYGSDAIAGVVNFITRRSQDGGFVAADYRLIEGSKGDYTAGAAWGGEVLGADVLVSAGYQHRSELLTLDRPFALTSYGENPNAGYGPNGNPGTFVPLGPTFAAVGSARRDVNCASLDGFPGFNGATPVCYSRSTQFTNLVEREERFQLFASANYDIGDRLRARVEALYAQTNTPEARTAPSQALTQVPTVEAAASPAVAGRFYVPAANPGFASYVAANPGVFPAATTGVQLAAYRPFYLGGNPLFEAPGGAELSSRRDIWRLSFGLEGDVTEDIRFDAGVTYSQNVVRDQNSDVLINRFQLALRGLGGPRCDAAPQTPGIQGAPGVGGCLWFNPFSTAVQRNPATGSTNPQFNPAVANSEELVRWLYVDRQRRQESSLWVGDLVFSGELPIQLDGGNVAWAVGGQYRRDGYVNRPSDISNSEINPCVATPDFGVTTCTSRTGPFGLLAPSTPVDVHGEVWALFSELQIPLTDDIDIQAAARYESYGGSVGSTFNPKVSAKWALTDWLGVRGSVGTTFRGPPTTATDANADVSLQSVRGAFRTIFTLGTPDLKPETALAYNVGGLVEHDRLRVSVDYWGFDFKDSIINEPVGPIATALYPTNTTNRCVDPGYAAIRGRFNFVDLNGDGSTTDDCIAGNISSLNTLTINGSKVKTTGLDISVSYRFEDVLGGDLRFGVDATRTLTYDLEALHIEGVLAAPAFDAIGKLNFQTAAFPTPPWRGSGYLEYGRGPHSLRWTVTYLDAYTDQRTELFAPNTNYSADGVTPVAITAGQKINSWTTHSLSYRSQLPWGATLTAVVDNLFDTKPPFARLNYNYDPFTAIPLGRTAKIGIRKSF